MEQSEIKRQNGNLKELIFSLADPAAWELSRSISEKSIAVLLATTPSSG